MIKNNMTEFWTYIVIFDENDCKSLVNYVYVPLLLSSCSSTFIFNEVEIPNPMEFPEFKYSTNFSFMNKTIHLFVYVLDIATYWFFSA